MHMLETVFEPLKYLNSKNYILIWAKKLKTTKFGTMQESESRGLSRNGGGKTKKLSKTNTKLSPKSYFIVYNVHFLILVVLIICRVRNMRFTISVSLSAFPVRGRSATWVCPQKSEAKRVHPKKIAEPKEILFYF